MFSKKCNFKATDSLRIYITYLIWAILYLIPVMIAGLLFVALFLGDEFSIVTSGALTLPDYYSVIIQSSSKPAAWFTGGGVYIIATLIASYLAFVKAFHRTYKWFKIEIKPQQPRWFLVKLFIVYVLVAFVGKQLILMAFPHLWWGSLAILVVGWLFLSFLLNRQYGKVTIEKVARIP